MDVPVSTSTTNFIFNWGKYSKYFTTRVGNESDNVFVIVFLSVRLFVW